MAMSKKTNKKKLGLFIPVYKNFVYLKHMLDSVKSELRDIEFYLINNGSDDETTKFCKILSRRKGFHLKHFDEALGVSRVWNMSIDWAIELGLNEIIITNSDLLFHPDCIDTLSRYMDRNESAQLVCPLDIKKVQSVLESYPFLSEKEMASFRYSADGIARFKEVLDSIEYKSKDPKVISNIIDYSCFMIRPKMLINQVGYFDQNFLPAYWEDTDMHWRLASFGHVSKTIMNANILHIQSRSVVEGDFKNNSYVPNAFYFSRKHNMTFTPDKLFRDENGSIYAIRTCEASEPYKFFSTEPDRRIIDCFIFDGDLDALEVKLEMLHDVVDSFIIIEAAFDYEGNPKPLYLKENKERFAKYLGKIKRLVITDFKNADNPDARKNLLLRALASGIRGMRFTDIMVLSDVYSLFDVRKVKEFQRMLGVKQISTKKLANFINITSDKTIDNVKFCTVKCFQDDFGGDMANFSLSKGFVIEQGGFYLDKMPNDQVDRDILSLKLHKISIDHRHLPLAEDKFESLTQWLWNPSKTNTHKGEASVDVTLEI